MWFLKLKKVHLLVSELYMYQNARCNNKKNGNYVPYFGGKANTGIFFLLFLWSCHVIIISPMLHTHIPLTCHRRSITTVTDGLVKKTHVSSDTLDWNADRNIDCSNFPEFCPSQQQMLGECFICRLVLLPSISWKFSYISIGCAM